MLAPQEKSQCEKEEEKKDFFAFIAMVINFTAEKGS